MGLWFYRTLDTLFRSHRHLFEATVGAGMKSFEAGALPLLSYSAELAHDLLWSSRTPNLAAR
jgi:hypothetical protein